MRAKFQLIVHALGCAFVMNGPLRDIATNSHRLAMRRPGFFLSINSQNRKGLKAPSEPAGLVIWTQSGRA